MCAAHSRADGFAEDLAKRFGVLLGGRKAYFAFEIRPPVALFGDLARPYRNGMRRRQATDSLEMRVSSVVHRSFHEQRHLQRIDVAWNIGQCEQRLRLGREREQSFRLEVVEGLHAHRIPGAEQLIDPRIPQRKREIADDMLDAARSPSVVCVGNQFGIGYAGSVADMHRRDQVRAVVDSRLSDKPH